MNTEIAKQIGKRIADSRKNKRIEQSELASLLNVSQPTLANWEKGRRELNYEAIIKISRILTVSTDVLFGTEVEVSANENKLLNYFRSLNEEGQEKLLEQAEFFVSSGKYIKNNKSEMVQAK